MPASIASLHRDNTIADALRAIDRSAIGMALLVDDQGVFERTVTDGDLRRLMLAGQPLEASLDGLPALASVTGNSAMSRKAALALMNEHQIDQLPILDDDRRAVDILLRRDIDRHILLSTPHLGEDEMAFVLEAFSTNWIAPLGPNVDAFEREIAEMVGVEAACAVSSGTAAIHLGLRLLGVGQGDRVFVSDFTFIGSVGPITYQGAEPVFIDSEPESWNMSPTALKAALEDAAASERLPKAIVIVNLYGQSADMDPLLALAKAYDVPVLEDAAESLGAYYKGRPSGTFGEFGAYSFNGNKIITTSGGGMLIGQNAELIQRARMLSAQARQPFAHYEHVEIGYNYRMSNILAGVGRGQLRVLGKRVERRRAINERYREGWKDISAIRWMPEPEWSHSNRWLSCITIEDEEKGKDAASLIAWLGDQLIETRPLWKPMHAQPVFAQHRLFPHEPGNRPVGLRLFETGLCLPSGSNMSDADVDHVIAATRVFFEA